MDLHARLTVVFAAAALATASLMIGACGSERTGPVAGADRSHCQVPVPWYRVAESCAPSSTTTGPPTAIPTYNPRENNGRGWSTQAIDQPRPLPSSRWKWKEIGREKGVCAWADDKLLAAFGWAGELDGDGPFCNILLGNGDQALQIGQEIFWEPFEGPVVEKFAFMRPLTIEGLQAREYNLQSGAEAIPGSCMVEVNTRSLNHISVLAAREGGTDPAPMCQKAREVATLMVKRFVPLAGGTPYPETPQQPKPGLLGVKPDKGVCDVFRGAITWAFLEGTTGQDGKDGSATTCTWSKDDAQGSGRLTPGVPADWPATLPPLADGEITADTKLGVMSARVQLTKDGAECAETAEYAPGEILRFAYRNPMFTPAELCRIAENALGSALNAFADITAR